MQNNSFNMKRVFITLGLLLGVLCFSYDNNVKNRKENLNKQTEEKAVKKNNQAKVTKHPDTIIDGVRIYNFKSEPAKSNEISLEEAINLFERGVNEAKTCSELIKACSTFDANIKKLSQKNSNINLVDIEKREDVKSVRRISEEKSLRLCQTQQMR